MSQPTSPDSEELARFREEWRAEVRRRAQEVHGHEAKASASVSFANGAAVHEQPDGTSTGHAPNTVSQPPALASAKPPPALPANGVTTRQSAVDPSKLPASVQRALDVYRRAVACEQRSEIDEALRLYRLAFRMNDRVGRIYEELEYSKYHPPQTKAESHGGTAQAGGGSSTATTVHAPSASVSVSVPVSPELKATTKRTSVDGIDQITRGLEEAYLAAAPTKSGTAVVATGSLAGIVATWPMFLCFDPEEEKEPTPINLLPDEILVKIVGYLDTTSVERFASVSRKARVLTLDASVWRWRVITTYRPPQISEEENLAEIIDLHLGDPRRLFIEQPRVRLDGVYIAVCHYIRQGLGETVWVNVSHLVTYHRYLRFYPTGQVVSLLANEGETPQQAIPKLQLTSQEKSLSIGTWRLSGTTVYITDLLDVLAGESSKYMFQMTLELRSRPLGRWNRLTMQSYETVAISDGEAIALPLKNERPFWFSKVRSYGM